MGSEEPKQLIELFLNLCDETNNLAKTASRNNKSLSGSNFYGNKFHDLLINFTKSETGIQRLIQASSLSEAATEEFYAVLKNFKSSDFPYLKRQATLKQIRMFLNGELLPLIENLKSNSVPETEQVLPLAVVQNTRRSIEKVVLQANGCYEHEWYDACAVMIRRLIETLIIELYEKKGKSADIQDKDGNFLMLNALVERVLADKTWNLARETKPALPLIKSLGDRSAHNRHYLAKKSDIDKSLHGLRVAVDDLLHLSGLK